MIMRCDPIIVPVTAKVGSSACSEECPYVTGISRTLHRRE
jgi:hypothetical protein